MLNSINVQLGCMYWLRRGYTFIDPGLYSGLSCTVLVVDCLVMYWLRRGLYIDLGLYTGFLVLYWLRRGLYIDLGLYTGLSCTVLVKTRAIH